MRPLIIWLPALRSGSGADIFTHRLAASLEKAGHKPIVQWFDRRLELMPSLLKRVRAPENIDVVHANTWQGFAFKREGVPLAVTEHHISLHPLLEKYHSPAQRFYHRHFVQRWNRQSYALASAVVAISSFCAEPLRSVAGEKLRIINNGVDTNRFCPAQEEVIHHPFRLLFVGNPSRRKGSDLLEPLARRLGPDFEVRCLGGLRCAHASGDTGGVRYLPGTAPDDMPNLYRAADALVVPTRFENFSYVVLEAMACGLPVIGFARGGTAEQCVDGETGLLCEVDDLDALATNARRLAADGALRHRLGKNARQRAVKLYSEERCAMAYVNLYREILAAQSKAA
ncbi:MAG: glycosyltransferase family 4 protein [Candidatus Accumulibacter sp.]|jgi:glycosyltransferase involved in cell wall biosynthesis|nr:glycosyltransferase family 4 protein [Accumulibacter sp.]